MLNLWGVIPLTFDDAKVIHFFELCKYFEVFNITLTQFMGIS